MKTLETKLPVGKIIDIKKLSDDTWVIKQEVLNEEMVIAKEDTSIPKITIPENLYQHVEAESLSLKDEFMKHKPKTEAEKKTKQLIKEAIAKGVKNFYRPMLDPSFASDGKNICFEKGKKPAIGKSRNWWKKVAQEYNPERNSRLGTIFEYGAFLGVVIKKLVEEGKTVKWAWNAVCNDSKELRHYWNFKDAKHDFEFTGSRCVCEYYDFVNTYKILAEDDETGIFSLASGLCNFNSHNIPLASLQHFTRRVSLINNSVGWVVLS